MNMSVKVMANGEIVPVVAAVLVDPATGLPVAPGGGNGGTPGGDNQPQYQYNPTGGSLTAGDYASPAIGVLRQQIVEVAIWKGDSQPMGTLEQPATDAQLRATALPVTSTKWRNLGTAVVNNAAVAVGIAAASAIAAKATRVCIRIRNSGTTRIALGATGVTFATAAVVLEPGDLWVEDDAPQVAWFAISDAAGGALAVTEITG